MFLTLASLQEGVVANWDLVCTLFILFLILASFALGRRAGGGRTEESWLHQFMSGLTGNFTNVLAYVVVMLAFLGILILSWKVLAAGSDAAATESAKFVFGAVLPLLGTWMGTVLAHYFQKENFEAASKSVIASAQSASGAEKLQATPVEKVMIRPADFKTLPDAYVGKSDAEIPLAALIQHMTVKPPFDRIGIFRDNLKAGPPATVVHLSTIEKFIASRAVAAPTTVGDLTLFDLYSDPHFAQLISRSFGLVEQEAHLGRAKSVMENLSQSLGSAGNCYDVFVTATGKPAEPVLGWITNDILNQNARV